jgi:hypothetical protein
MLGDFNSSTRVSSQKRSHPRFVQAALAQGMVSAYHEQTGERHGEESVPTYLHGNGAEFHLDYGFVSQPLVESVRCRIADEPHWFEIGDHRPIILDIDDAVSPAAKSHHGTRDRQRQQVTRGHDSAAIPAAVSRRNAILAPGDALLPVRKPPSASAGSCGPPPDRPPRSTADPTHHCPRPPAHPSS